MALLRYDAPPGAGLAAASSALIPEGWMLSSLTNQTLKKTNSTELWVMSVSPVLVNKSAKLSRVAHANSTVLSLPSGAVFGAFVDLFLFNAKLPVMIYLEAESAVTEGWRLCYWETSSVE